VTVIPSSSVSNGQGEVFLYHNEETSALLVLIVSVDDRFLNQLLRMLFARRPRRLSGFQAGTVPPILLHLKMSLPGKAKFHVRP
jgi:hypothetical protein